MSRAMTPEAALARDLKRMEARAFHMGEWSAPLLRRLHAWTTPADAPARMDPTLELLYPWLFVPPTLWPFNLHHVTAGCLAALERGRPPGPRLRLLVDLLPDAPGERVCAAVAEHERQVQHGAYEHLVTTPAKFRQNEETLRADPRMLADWARLKTAFPVQLRARRDPKGVVRRSMCVERNLRPGFTVNPRRAADLLAAAFDAFCLRWNLYGMQHDEPLLLKLAVNVTPYGTMIHVPAYWSFDPKRDLRWDAVARLHRLRVAQRQGNTLAAGKAERRRLARRLVTLDRQVLRRGLRGEDKHRFLCAGLGWITATSPRRIARLRAEFAG